MVDQFLFEDYLPPFSLNDIGGEYDEEGNLILNGGVARPETYVLCVDNKTKAYTTECAKKTEWGSTDLLITIENLDALYAEYGPHYMSVVERALGENSYLAKYDYNMASRKCQKLIVDGEEKMFVPATCPAKYSIDASGLMLGKDGAYYRVENKAHLSTNCGLIRAVGSGAKPDDYDSGSNFILTNTRYESVTIPRVFVNTYEDIKTVDRLYLACITELYSTYAGCCNGEIEGNCNDEKKWGCRWDSIAKSCVSVCSDNTTVKSCQTQEKKGCVWNFQREKCEGSCGSIAIRPGYGD